LSFDFFEIGAHPTLGRMCSIYRRTHNNLARFLH